MCCKKKCCHCCRCGCQNWDTTDWPTRRILVNDLEALAARNSSCNCGCGCGCGCGNSTANANANTDSSGCGDVRLFADNIDIDFANVFNNHCSCQ